MEDLSFVKEVAIKLRLPINVVIDSISFVKNFCESETHRYPKEVNI
jgi:hypothetical protein